MKLTLFLSMLTIFQLFATETYSQMTKITLKLADVTISDALKEIENKSEFFFLYSPKLIDVEKKVNIDADKEPIKEILTGIFGKDVRCLVYDRQIILSPSSVSETSSVDQQKKVTGKVTDKTGNPLPGVSIVVKGTTSGTTTDPNGDFSLVLPPDAKYLTFSFIGMAPQEVTIGNQTAFDIVLQEAALTLDEVVVIGYGTQKKVNLTGAVGTVNQESLVARPVVNATQMLQGIVPGLNITQNSGTLDTKPTINIRGITTIGQGSTGSPLVLIDGMEGDINSINPSDIESVSVLKDAAASSIYGSRAPFGVILVTTKKGSATKSTISYSNNFRWNSPINIPDMMDSYTFALFFNDASANSGQVGLFSAETLQKIQDYQAGKLDHNTEPNTNGTSWLSYGGSYNNVNWYDVIYRNSAFSQEHNLSASGGNEKFKYYTSGNYLGQNGLMVFHQDFYDRYSISTNLDATLNKWATLNSTSRLVRQISQRPRSMSSGLYSDLARQGWPTLPVYDPNGWLYSCPSPALPLRDAGDYKNIEDIITEQIQIVLEPIKQWKTFINLNFRSRINSTSSSTLAYYNHDPQQNPVIVGSGTTSIYKYAYKENYFNTNLYTEYSRSLGRHNLKLMVGSQMESFQQENFSATRNGIMIPEELVLNLTTGLDASGNPVAPTITGELQKWAIVGIFGRMNYDYDGRYLLEANLRYDGSSRFREDQRWKIFPSVSVGWNVSKESFFETLSNIVGTMKIRASYGELGNQNTSSYYPTYVTQPVTVAGGTWLIGGAKPIISSAPGLVSQTLGWERIRSFDVGLDLSLLKGRLTSTFDYYMRRTLNMVGPAPELPVILGTSVPRTNNTDLKTWGFEFQVSWRDHIGKDLGYGIQLMLSDNQTIVTRYPNPTGSLSTYRSDQKLGEIWGLETIGIAKSAEEMTTYLATLTNGGQNAIGSQWTAGDIMYRDLNNDLKIDKGASTITNYGDLKIIGNNEPRYRFSVVLDANWKGFDLRSFFQGILKRDYFQNSYYFFGATSSGVWWSTGFVQHKDYFRLAADHPLGQNLDSYYARPLYNSSKNTQAQTHYLLNAAYVRLKNLQLGYTLPNRWTRVAGVEKLRVYVSAENILTFTKMTKIFDPESIDGGYGGSVYPLSKIISFGVNVNF